MNPAVVKTDKRFRNGGHFKKACVNCGHGIAIHHAN